MKADIVKTVSQQVLFDVMDAKLISNPQAINTLRLAFTHNEELLIKVTNTTLVIEMFNVSNELDKLVTELVFDYRLHADAKSSETSFDESDKPQTSFTVNFDRNNLLKNRCNFGVKLSQMIQQYNHNVRIVND